MYGFGDVAIQYAPAPAAPPQTADFQSLVGAVIVLPARVIEQIRPGTFGTGIGSVFSALPFSLAVWAAAAYFMFGKGGR